MKVIIRVWEPEKPHDPHEGMPMTTIVEYDQFEEPEVIGHDILIERCKYDALMKTLIVYLDKFPARVDADPHFEELHLLAAKEAQLHPEGYTLLDADRGKGIILWTNPNNVVAEVS